MDSEFLRTSNLGIEFFQSGKRCPIYLENEAKKRYRVSMSPKPFELRFPNANEVIGVKICAAIDPSIYEPSIYTSEEFYPDERIYFWPGKGLADTIFSTSQLCIRPENCNYLDMDGRLVRDGNYGKMIYRNYFTDDVRNFSLGLNLYLAIGLDTTNSLRKDIEEVILDFDQNDESSLPKLISPQLSTKTLKIFIASSFELQEERKQVEDYLDRENKSLNKKNIFIETVICEDFNDSISRTRKQDDYNKAILESDIVLCLFFTKAGNFSIEEFKVAHNNFLKQNTPIIYTYFKNAQIDISKISSKDLISKEVFLEYLIELQHFPSYYTSSQDLIIQFRRQLDSYFLEKKLL
ncbi:hypothetical protein C8N25_13037 [Algoriphagus antarcticus]|uniref:Uncharacterized protein n=2 Tax=Algoriphagus antarcticus TaxID=238540 RepID=A0A3E0DA99_9BACT|nr:hypothetical protein C8N25_13037 [Algoriphagus antarcticus]